MPSFLEIIAVSLFYAKYQSDQDWTADHCVNTNVCPEGGVSVSIGEIRGNFSG